MPRIPRHQEELDAAAALERVLQTLRHTEAAFAKLCEELRQERRRTAQAVRCVDEYRRLYWMARARLANLKKASGMRQQARKNLTVVNKTRKVAQLTVSSATPTLVTRR